MTEAATWDDYTAGYTWDSTVLTPPAQLVTKLRAHVSAPGGDSSVEDCVLEALGLLDRLLGEVTSTIPTAVLDRAVVEVGADLWHRRSTKNGIASFGDGLDVPPIRIRRDPLDAARPLLFHWLPGGFA